MSAALRPPMSLEAFLEWEERQELRWEFDGIAPRAMTGVTREHARIQANLVTALTTRLRGSPCEAYGSDLKVETAGAIRYPDAFVQCTPSERGSTVMREPVVVFEILSPSTQDVDRFVKNREYRATPSIQRYVILEQDRVAATVFTRDGDDWVGRVLLGDETLRMPEIGIEIPLPELYEGVDLPPPAPPEDPREIPAA